MMRKDYDAIFEENARVLNDLKRKDVNLSPERMFSFAHKFKDQSHAESFAAEVVKKGLKATINLREDGDYDVLVYLRLTPNVEQITELEQSLSQLADAFGGHADGWEFEDDDNVTKL